MFLRGRLRLRKRVGPEEISRGAGARRLAAGAGRARRLLRRATRAAQERVRVPARPGCREVRAALRGVVRVHAYGPVRGGPPGRAARHRGTAGAEEAVGVKDMLRRGSRRPTSPHGPAGRRRVPRLPEGDDRARGALHAAGVFGDLDQDARRALREGARGRAGAVAAAGGAGPPGVRGARQEVRATAVIHTSADPTGMKPTSAVMTAVRKEAS